MVPSPLQTGDGVVHGGKHAVNHAGGVGAERSAQLMFASMF
jgi:hypothetical protein